MRWLVLVLLLGIAITPVYAYNSGFRPIYQPNLPSSGGPAQQYCSLGDFFQAYNSTTHVFICGTPPSGSGGENNTASNVGTGSGIFKQKVGADLQFKSLLDDGIISIGNLTNEISFTLGFIPKSHIDTAGVFGWNEVSKIASSIHDISDVTEIDCVTGQTLRQNSTGQFACYTIPNLNLKVDTLPTIATNKFISAFDNSTGDWSTKTFGINTKDCGSQAVKSIDNSTGNITCISIGGTDTNTAQIVSAGGTSLFKSRDNATQNTIKGLTTTYGVTLTANTNDVNITPNFKVNTKSSATRQFFNSFNNATTSGNFGTITFGANTSTCGVNNFFSAFDNSTGVLTCTTSSGSGITSINSAPATTAKIIQSNSTTKATFKTLTQGTGITLTNGSSAVTIATNFKTNTKSCSAGQFVSSYDNSTGVYTCTTPTASGGVTSLANNVTASVGPTKDTLIWSIPLTTNSGNAISGVLVVSSSATGNGVQVSANTTVVNGIRGWCHYTTPLTTTTDSLDNIVLPTILTGRATNTGDITGLAGANVPYPISFQCGITVGATGGNLRMFMNPELGGNTINAKAGSFYIKTP